LCVFFSGRRKKETTTTFDHILCEVLGSISSALCELFICVLLLFSRRKKNPSLVCYRTATSQEERRRRSLNQEQVTTINQWDFVAMEEEDLQQLQVCCNAALPC
jgi:hypothetical protein